MNYMKLLCLVLLASTLVLAQDSYDFTKERKKSISVDSLLAYNKWKFSSKRAYLSEEEQIFRQFIFFDNFKKVQDHNNNPNATYKVEINQFSDMTEEEFEYKMLNQAIQNTNNLKANDDHDDTDEESDKRKLQTLPTSVDWRSKGAVAAVKNQGMCGSCWAFSTTGALEAVSFLRGQGLSTFSEQQLVDCCTRDSGFVSSGCNGGWPFDALTYVKKFGIVNSSAYPYIGSKGACKITAPSSGFYISSYSTVAKNITALKAAVAIQPVSIIVHATAWVNYKSGVFNACYSDPLKANHAVLLVGYTEQGDWIVKNSWGAAWGQQGYITLAGNKNTCGVYNYAVVPKI